MRLRLPGIEPHRLPVSVDGGLGAVQAIESLTQVKASPDILRLPLDEIFQYRQRFSGLRVHQAGVGQVKLRLLKFRIECERLLKLGLGLGITPHLPVNKAEGEPHGGVLGQLSRAASN